MELFKNVRFLKGYQAEALRIKEDALKEKDPLYALGRYVKSLGSNDENYIKTQISFFHQRPKLKYLLIDLDNTIFDFTKAELLSLRLTFENLGIEAKDSYINTYLEINHELWKALERREITKEQLSYQRFAKTFAKLKLEPELAFKAEYFYNRELAKHPFYLSGAEKAIEELSQDYAIAIITNGFKDIQRPRIANSTLSDHIKALYISQEIGYDKPAKEFFEYVLHDLKDLDKSHYLIVGDSLSSDIKGASNIGIEAVLVGSTNHENVFDLTSLAYLKRVLAFAPFDE